MEDQNDTEALSENDDKHKITSIPEVKEKLATSTSLLDERYAHVSKSMTTFWGRAEFYDYTNDLMLYSPSDTRPSRKGFLDEAVNEILLVIEVHTALFPHLHK